MTDSGPKEVKKEKKVSLSQGILYGVGCGIGGSIFVLLGTGIEVAGPGILISLFLGGILIFFTALNYSELTTSLPISGGAYNFSKEGLGGFLAFIIGFFLWIANIVTCSFSAQSFALVISIFFPILSNGTIIIAIIAILFTTIVFFRTQQLAIRTLIILTITLIIIFIIFIFSGLFIAPFINSSFHNPNFIYSDFSFFGVIQMFALMFIFFTSITSNLAYFNPGMEQPSKNIPRVNIIAIVLTSLIYLLITYVVLINIGDGSGTITQSPVLLAEVLLNILGPFGFILMGIAAIISTMIMMNAALGSAVSVFQALSRDKYIPDFFSKLNKKNKVPIFALILTTCLAIFFAMMAPIGFAAEMTSFIYFFGLALINIAAVRLRYKRKELDRPFKAPFFPYLPIVVSVICLTLALFLGVSAIIMGFLIATIGISYYLLTIADRHSIVITLAGMKFLCIVILGFFIWMVANLATLSSPLLGTDIIFREVLLRFLIYIAIFGLGTVMLDVIPLREFAYFFIRKLDKEKVAIAVGGMQIIEMDKKALQRIHMWNNIIAIIQLVSAAFVFMVVLLIGFDVVSIEKLAFGNIIIPEGAIEFLFSAILITFGILLSFCSLTALYVNRESMKLGI